MHVGSLLARHALHRPDHTAVVCGAHRLTFREAAARVDRLANHLRSSGLREGDAVVVALPNCVELLDAYRACAQLGLVSVPLSTMLRGAGLATPIRDSGAKAVIACAALGGPLDDVRHELGEIPDARWLVVGDAPRAGWTRYGDAVAAAGDGPAPVADVGDDRVYNIIYSSGTTGAPKGIVHTHRVRALYGALFASQFRFTPESVVMHAGSLVFNGAFVTLMPAWFLGCTYVLQEKFDAVEFIETVARERVTHVMMVPSQIVAVLDAPNFCREKLQTLEMLSSVGAPWHREHKARMLEVLPDSLYELYGLTEGFITVLDRTDFARHIDTVGHPIVFSQMKIVDAGGRTLPPDEVGEVVGTSPLMMPGYHNRPDLTAQALRDGWLYTGDLGTVDEHGFLRLVDRAKDLIITGGVNVYPRDIEEVVARHPAVREVAVFGLPNDKWGESPVAAVVPRGGVALDPDELRAWVNARVDARYQQLHGVYVLDELPRSTAGKTLKRVLRERYAPTTSAAPLSRAASLLA